MNLKEIRALAVGACFAVAAMFTAQLGVAQAAEKQPLLYEEPRHLEGKIYGLKAEALAKPLFTLSRSSDRKDSRLDVLREYKYLDGQMASRERVVYQGNELVSYELEELQIGVRGKATIVSEPANSKTKVILFERQTGNRIRKGKARSQDMVDTLISRHR